MVGQKTLHYKTERVIVRVLQWTLVISPAQSPSHCTPAPSTTSVPTVHPPRQRPVYLTTVYYWPLYGTNEWGSSKYLSTKYWHYRPILSVFVIGGNCSWHCTGKGSSCWHCIIAEESETLQSLADVNDLSASLASLAMHVLYLLRHGRYFAVYSHRW